VYNLEVGQWHNFLVGVSGVVVHNGPCNLLKDADGIPLWKNGFLNTRYKNVVFGKTEGLKEFAEKIGANYYQNWFQPWGITQSLKFDNQFFRMCSNIVKEKEGHIIFNLGKNKTGSALIDVKSATSNKLENLSFEQALEINLGTEWELSRILREGEYFDRTIFHINGVDILPDNLLNMGIKHIK
jgi:hypothetical protein